MSEEQRTDPTQGDPAPPSGTDDEAKAELEKWKALARENEKRAKANADAAKRLQELEDGQKSELEKLQGAQRAAEQRAAEAEQKAMRLEVAVSKGLTPAQAKRLVGTTQEELEADADEFLASIKPAGDSGDEGGGTETGLPRRPQERLTPGARPGAEPQPSAKEIVDRVMASSTL